METLELEQVFFPVGYGDVYVGSATGSGEVPCRRAPRFKAVVNLETGAAISIVGAGYKLISNREAFELGRECFRLLFDGASDTDPEVYNVMAPGTLSSCCIDLVGRDRSLSVMPNDVYFPFLRIANSYNRFQALRFNIGFCRSICKNGVIYGESSIKYVFPHTREGVGRGIGFDIKKGELRDLERAFAKSVGRLAAMKLEERYVLPVACRALGRRYDIGSSDPGKREAEKEKLKAFADVFGPLVRKYRSEMGDTVYAVFAALTDYASNAVRGERGGVNRVNGLQWRCGRWLREFLEARDRRDFSWEEYLVEYRPYHSLN